MRNWVQIDSLFKLSVYGLLYHYYLLCFIFITKKRDPYFQVWYMVETENCGSLEIFGIL